MSDESQPAISPDRIKGNASPAVKKILSNPGAFFGWRTEKPRLHPVFCDGINRRLVVTEASVEKKREDERKKEAIVVIELDVTEGELLVVILIVLELWILKRL